MNLLSLGLSADSLTLTRYTEKAKEAAKKVKVKFINTTSLLKNNMDGYSDKSGYKLTPEGWFKSKLHHQLTRWLIARLY